MWSGVLKGAVSLRLIGVVVAARIREKYPRRKAGEGVNIRVGAMKLLHCWRELSPQGPP